MEVVLSVIEKVVLMMVDEWLLEHLARVSTLSCILVVCYFLIYSIWRISQMPNYPWNWNEWQFPLGGKHAVEIHRKREEMPFTLSMNDRNKEDFGGTVFDLQFLKDREPPNVTVLWGPSVSFLMQLISMSWEGLEEVLKVRSLQEGEWNCLLNPASTSAAADPNSDEAATLNYFIIQKVRYPTNSLNTGEEVKEETTNDSMDDTTKSHISSKLDIIPPIDLDWNLLNNQFRYPAAIFVTNSETTLDSEGYYIKGIIQILHIKNEVFSKASATLTQYIKMSNGQSHILQPLYVIDDHRSDEDETKDENGAKDDLATEPFNDILCSVCQVMPVTRVIIPCRHVCLCCQCFQKVELCPICRGAILYYFRTRKETPEEIRDGDNNTSSSINTSAGQAVTWSQRLERWNEWFSNATGLIRN